MRFFPIILGLLLLSGCAMREYGLLNTPFPEIQDIDLDASPQREPLSQGSLFSDQNYVAGFTSDAKAYRINDVLIIRINESTSASSNAATETEKIHENDYGISNFLGFETTEGPKINPGFTPSAMIGTKSESTHDGSGTTKRSGAFSGYLAARVTRVLPSGFLVIQGHKTVRVNGEAARIYLSGLVNPLMVDKNSYISSNQIADLQLFYDGQGILAAQQKPGYLSRLLQAAWPF